MQRATRLTHGQGQGEDEISLSSCCPRPHQHRVGRKLCLKHFPAFGEATLFGITASARASLKAALVIVCLRGQSESMSY
eukprot:6028061-Pleurochrysis_carterae.AAC.4